MATKPPQPTKEDYEHLGRLMEHFLVRDYVHVLGSPRQRLMRATIQGLVVGLASVIGATVGVALLIYILGQFRELPGLGHLVETITQTIQSHNAIR